MPKRPQLPDTIKSVACRMVCYCKAKPKEHKTRMAASSEGSWCPALLLSGRPLVPSTVDSICNSPTLILLVRHPPPGDPESRKASLVTGQGLKDSQASTIQSIWYPLGHKCYRDSTQSTWCGHAIQAPGTGGFSATPRRRPWL